MIEILLEENWEEKHYKALVDFLNAPPEKLKIEFRHKVSIIDLIYSRILTPGIIDFLSRKGNTKIILLSNGQTVNPGLILDTSKKVAIFGYVGISKYPLLSSILFNLAKIDVEDVLGRCQHCKILFYRTRANMIYCGGKCRRKQFDEKSGRY